MPDPPADYNICPCCGTEFGGDDESMSHAELRNQWIAGGARWFYRQPPVGWNGWEQLQQANFVGLSTIPYVEPPSFTIDSGKNTPVLYQQPIDQASGSNVFVNVGSSVTFGNTGISNIAFNNLAVSNIVVGNTGTSYAVTCDVMTTGLSSGHSLTQISQCVGGSTAGYVVTGAPIDLGRTSVGLSPFTGTLATSGPETEQQLKGEVFVSAS